MNQMKVFCILELIQVIFVALGHSQSLVDTSSGFRTDKGSKLSNSRAPNSESVIGQFSSRSQGNLYPSKNSQKYTM